MPAKPISLGPAHFDRKGDAETYLKDMLYRYELGDRVSANDALVLAGALEHHPDSVGKIGVGVDYFSVRSADFGSRCFWVNRVDGSTDKFSITACIYG